MTDLAKLRELLDSNKSNETHRCYWCREITSGLCDCNAVEDITTLLDEVEKLRAALRDADCSDSGTVGKCVDSDTCTCPMRELLGGAK